MGSQNIKGNGNTQISGNGNSVNSKAGLEVNIVEINGITIKVKGDKVSIFGSVSKVKLNEKKIFWVADRIK